MCVLTCATDAAGTGAAQRRRNYTKEKRAWFRTNKNLLYKFLICTAYVSPYIWLVLFKKVLGRRIWEEI
jgi:hypothetical protein